MGNASGDEAVFISPLAQKLISAEREMECKGRSDKNPHDQEDERACFHSLKEVLAAGPVKSGAL
jgi:hypothetical protein